jgi:hypothetical protein
VVGRASFYHRIWSMIAAVAATMFGSTVIVPEPDTTA